jgi:FkbM family methyltransferase
MKYEITFLDKKFSITTNNTHIAKSYKANKIYEHQLLHSLLRCKGLYVDVGSHVGNHVIFLSLFSSFEHIVAFEPCPEHFDMLKRNIKDNNLQNVTAYNLAIGEEDSSVNIIRKGPNDGSYSVTNGSEVNVKTLDSFSLQPSVIKYDVEGYEVKALEGSKNTILTNKPKVYIEMNDNKNAIQSIVTSMGYKLNRLIKMGSPMAEFVYG